MEKELIIPVEKGVSIYGRLNGSLKGKPLFIMVHGLGVSTTEGLYERAAEWFAKEGYASFRFNLYGWQKDARQLIDCTLETHVADLDMVVRYFRNQGVQTIFVAGHSFGGPTILCSKEQAFDAAVLWDPSYDLSFTKTKYGFPGGKFVKELGGYLMRWGVTTVVGEKMAKEVDALPWKTLTKEFFAPLKIIVAEKGVLVKGANAYFKTANKPKELAIMKGATHYFDDKEGMQEKLFELTKKWFEKV